MSIDHDVSKNNINPEIQSGKAAIDPSFNLFEDGSHRQLEKMIRRSLHNPQSFRVLDTGYWDGDLVSAISPCPVQEEGKGRIPQVIGKRP